QSLQREVRRSTAEQRGDWKPIVFLLTDGQPTDNWQEALARFRKTASSWASNLIAIGCGEDVDLEVLRAITPVTLLMKDLSAGALRAFFKWVSASVSTASVRLSGEGRPFELPGLPADALEVARPGGAPAVKAPSQVMLLARCQRDGQAYLM